MGTLNLTPILENSLKDPDASFLNARYCGEWEEGVKQGQGKFTYHNGDVFTVSSYIILSLREPLRKKYGIIWEFFPTGGGGGVSSIPKLL